MLCPFNKIVALASSHLLELTIFFVMEFLTRLIVSYMESMSGVNHKSSHRELGYHNNSRVTVVLKVYLAYK